MPSARSSVAVPSPLPATSSRRTVANQGLRIPKSRYRRPAGLNSLGWTIWLATTTGRIRPRACLILALVACNPISRPEPIPTGIRRRSTGAEELVVGELAEILVGDLAARSGRRSGSRDRAGP